MTKSLTRNFGLSAVAALALSGSAFAADLAAGKAVYSAKCKTCHAADGSGNPAMFKIAKADVKALSEPTVQAKSDADLKKDIVNGFGKMKAVPLPPADLDNVVLAVRAFKK